MGGPCDNAMAGWSTADERSGGYRRGPAISGIPRDCCYREQYVSRAFQLDIFAASTQASQVTAVQSGQGDAGSGITKSTRCVLRTHATPFLGASPNCRLRKSVASETATLVPSQLT
jgi:hypothetical protein